MASYYERLIAYLRRYKCCLDVYECRGYDTAYQTAQALKVDPAKFAKAVVLLNDGAPVIAVVPANCYVNIKYLKRILGARSMCLADESQIKSLFPTCELGAIPPLSLPGDDAIPIVLDTIFFDMHMHQSDIYFKGGSHTRIIKMKDADFICLQGTACYLYPIAQINRESTGLCVVQLAGFLAKNCFGIPFW